MILVMGWGAQAEAQAVGERHLSAHRTSVAIRDATGDDTLRITVWYPAEATGTGTLLSIGPPADPLFVSEAVFPDAPPLAGPALPVILLSHGFGGSARMMSWFGVPMARAGYVVVAVDHPGNNAMDEMTVRGAVLWSERVTDLSAALTAADADAVLGPHLDAGQVGVAGFSIGGFTALVGGGARISVEAMRDFCERTPEDGACRPQVEQAITSDAWAAALNDPAVAPYTATMGADHTIPGVKAVFAMAPIVQPADQASLRSMRIPVSLVVGADDVVAPPQTHARIAAARIPGAVLAELPDAGHYVYLSDCTAKGLAVISICTIPEVKSAAHLQAISAATSLFASVFQQGH